MEPAGLGIGVFGLVGLFNNAVDCFKYVQLGRNLGIDFQTSLLKLDMAQLRLSRWGEAVGLSGDIQKARSLQEPFGSEHDVRKAEEVLGHIIELFDRAEQISAKLRGQSGRDTPSRAYDPENDLEPAYESLHDKMRHLCLGRQNRAGLREKAKWALYKEEHARKLIGEVTDLVKDLTELFPASKATQQMMCQDEAREILQITSNDSLAVLTHLAACQDVDLEAAISRIAKPHSFSGCRMMNNWNNASGVRIGQQIGQQNTSGGLNFY